MNTIKRAKNLFFIKMQSYKKNLNKLIISITKLSQFYSKIKTIPNDFANFDKSWCEW